ncbi:pentapeptide repeat-containing protein [Desulfovibrio sp. UIB00]|uniref:pentapeptide repeat-containing protein n=1 Tax=Desulfovibrio sp. UIB00 TaxID=2804314 RepID=UPI001F116E0A|nr:pentapeptide repeat-containing protein [Desulfovibrio sp. UIB00]MCH5144141.1 pentapeptide repeat-containing protein [Desulfovibrio sp. UIB00]
MSDIQEPKQELFCDPDQYARLLRCSKKKNMAEWNNWREANLDVEIWLQGAKFRDAHLEEADFRGAHCEHASFSGAHCERANFWGAHCEGANFREAHCEGANFLLVHCEGTNFWWAHCEGANFLGVHCEGAEFREAHCEGADFGAAHCEEAIFWRAYCEGANFREAHCEGAYFVKAQCEGANFRYAQFSTSTNFFYCTIDDASDFSYTALGSIMVEPDKRARMEYNIRRLAWKQQYVEQAESLQQVFLINGWQKVSTILSSLLAWLYLCPVRFFWHVSDYGYSTGRVIRYFIFFILLFTLLYTFFPWMLMVNNTPIDAPLPERFLQMLAFATSTMVTLGFSNINVAIENGRPVLAGMLVVSCNLIVGYFMLAVLVTRLGILFQSMGPGEPRNKKVKVKRP